MSKLDQLYRSLILSKFFVKGWGNPENLKRIFEFRKIISCRDTCKTLVSPDYPIIIDKDEKHKKFRLLEGHFQSPLNYHMPGVLPIESEVAKFQMVLPIKWSSTNFKPVCIHLAGTGDHFYWRRRTFLAHPLLQESEIASIILENPYYGARKPKIQKRSSLHNVSDLFIMGGALVLESLALMHWCVREGYGPLGITGLSMGGHMASLAATNWPEPIVLVPCLSWSTASVVFTEGVLSQAIPWNLLQKQYNSETTFEKEFIKMIHSPEPHIDKAFSQEMNISIQNIIQLKNDNINLEKKNDDRENLKIYQNSQNKTVLVNQPNILTAASTPEKKILKPITYITSNGRNIFKNINFIASMMSFVSNKSLEIKNSSKKFTNSQQTLDFMRGIMDDCTHLGNFSIPVDTSLVIIVVATSDAYYPRNSVLSLEQIWPGAEVRYIDSGHITAFLFKQGVFRQAIKDGFDRYKAKYTNIIKKELNSQM